MNTSMADPHEGMLSFQHALLAGILELGPVSNHQDLFSHFDVPAPGVNRLTYVRLSKDRRTVKAFVSCVMNGRIDGFPCVAVGYATPQEFRNQGYSKHILKDVINDQARQAKNNGFNSVYIEAVIDTNNVPSQRVAESVLSVERESITDSASGIPAYRYTAKFNGTP